MGETSFTSNRCTLSLPFRRADFLGRLRPHPPTRADVFSHITLDYKAALNALALLAFAALLWLTIRRGATDPVCGMTVDRAKALTATVSGKTYYFCSSGCLASFKRDRARYISDQRTAVGHTHL